MARPIGAWIRASRRRRRPRRAGAPRGRRSSSGCPSRRRRQRASAGPRPGRDVELLVVGEHADRRRLVDGSVRRNRSGHSDDELVGLGEALRRDEARPRVTDRDAVAEQLADSDERGSVVDRAEDVEGWPRRESHGRRPACRRDRRALSPRASRRATGVGAFVEPLCARGLAARGHRQAPRVGPPARPRRAQARARCRGRRSGSRPCRRRRPTSKASSWAIPYSRSRAGAPSSTSCASRITDGSTRRP